ncbi:MAG TPA: hypothetical protein V6D15_18725 [Oculatellaceae cyanobacterium]|jgi:hypothetical protein
MNSKLKIHLLSRSNEQGFAMLAALGIGLVMFLVGVTMVVRSQGDQITATTQKSTTQSLSATEVGLTRVQALLKLIPKLGQKNFSDWPATYSAYVTGKTCLNDVASSDLLSGNWVNIVDSTNATKGKFKIVSYAYDDSKNIGTLTLAGQDGATNSINSTSSVQVKIPLVAMIGIPVPALWSQTFTMGNNKVQGNVLVHGCTIPSGVSSSNVQPLADGTQSAVIPNVSVAYPDLPALPSVCPSSGTMPQTCYQLFKNSQTTTLTNIPESITTPTTLPRSWDQAGADGVYRYLIGKNGSGNSIDLQQNGESLTVKTDDSTTPKKKVVLYLQGDLEMGGNTTINHTSLNIATDVKAANFVMYGSDGLGNYKHATDPTSVSNYKTTSISIGGNSSAAMVIYAPEATAGVNGGGSQPSTITGTVWVKGWDGSNANQVVVTQNLQWSELTDFTPPKTIAAIQSWQRQEAP